ncbi:Hypothetical predicted protein [Marmota monax]|uniref:Uncharacterized protein n=1 Tax=Marmota monax TaxID=9995 RepID=A0A5E4AL58_MARMO|nr:hypothetical protein GHT09_008483 [Marmota monax]VTJ58147.1 Hypothetical predicted protein [Marmota monax]
MVRSIRGQAAAQCSSPTTGSKGTSHPSGPEHPRTGITGGCARKPPLLFGNNTRNCFCSKVQF